MIYLKENYKGHIISFRKGNTNKKGKSIVSFKIGVFQGNRKSCGCFWCQGMWWKDEDYARIAAQTWIDEGRWYPSTGFVGRTSPRYRRRTVSTKR